MYIRGLCLKQRSQEFLGQQQAEPGFVSFGGQGWTERWGKLAREWDRPRSTPQGLPLLCETTAGVSSVSRQDSVVSTGTLCPEFTGTGRVTQTPASKDGEAGVWFWGSSPSSQDQSGNGEENRAEG